MFPGADRIGGCAPAAAGSNKEAIKKNKLWEEVLKSQNVHKCEHDRPTATMIALARPTTGAQSTYRPVVVVAAVMRPVLKEAREYLEKTFGYQLIQLPDTKFPGVRGNEAAKH